MSNHSPYASAAHVPLVKSPSLRIPRPVELPPDIHPLPEDVTAYFVYPFTLEPHILTLEESRRRTLASHAARHAETLRQRAEDKERRKREALRRIAPGFEPGASLVPMKMTSSGQHEQDLSQLMQAGDSGNPRQRDVMDDLVDHLAKLDAEGPTEGDGRLL